MSPAPDMPSDPAMDAAAPVARPVTLGKTRPFYWSLRRELWENRSVYLAPLAVAGVVLFGFLLGALHLVNSVRAASAPNAPHRAIVVLALPYDIAAGAVLVTGLIVSIFYCLGALHGERRDRSILFWKSLPVSDLTTVLSKVAIPLAIVPLVVFPVVLTTHLAMLALSAVILLASGLDPAAPWNHVPLGMMWLSMPYGLVILALWYAPICGWLLLVSAWARRVPILWALAPPLGLSLFEFLAFRTRYIWSLLDYRLQGGFAQAFTVGGQGKAEVTQLSQLDPLRVLGLPGLWAGLVFAAACFAACVWLRRRRDPI